MFDRFFLFFALVGVNANAEEPVLRMERNGPTVTVEASTDLKDWRAVTNLEPVGEQLFLRAQATQSLPFNFLYENRPLRDAPNFLGMIRDYYHEALPDTYPLQDEFGVRMYRAPLDGKIYNH